MSIFTRSAFFKPKKNKFNLSHELKMSGKFFKIYPVTVNEAVPGDIYQINTNMLVKFAPLIAPIMHRIDVYTHHFFVPYRILWKQWEKFITTDIQGDANVVLPFFRMSEANKAEWDKGKLADYLGIPPVDQTQTLPDASGFRVNALPFMAYRKIFLDYFIERNFSDSMDDLEMFPMDVSGEMQYDSTFSTVNYAAWAKDYFTSALPWTQRGGDVELPLNADVSYKHPAVAIDADGNPVTPTESGAFITASQTDGDIYIDNPNETDQEIGIDNIDNINFSAITIEDLRRSARLQEWLEINARAGSRYVEHILGHFGVQVPDYRLQRAEYLGGGKMPVVVSEIVNTAGAIESGDGSTYLQNRPQGDLSGYASSSGTVGSKRYKVTEHGVFMSVLIVKPKPAYMQGVQKLFRKFDNLDFYYPKFARLGEQPIENSEIFLDPVWSDTSQQNAGTFGYTPRYAEYKFNYDRVAGDFRDTLDFWHLAHKFQDLPVLDANFSTLPARTDIFAVDDGTDYLWIQVYNTIKMLRPMPYHAIPKL